MHEEFETRKREGSTKIIFHADDKIDAKDDKVYYSKTNVNGTEYKLNDFALVHPPDEDITPYVCKILSIHTTKKYKIAHVRWFALGEDTVLGKVADSKELFALHDCEDIELNDMIRLVQVEFIKIPDNWSQLGGEI